MGTLRTPVVLVVAVALVLGVGCGEDEGAAKRARERKAMAEKAAVRAEATRKIKVEKPPVLSKVELIEKCALEDLGGVCQQACAAGDASSCHRLGELYEQGKGGLPVDPETALLFYQRACKGDAASGCAAEARYYELGKVVPKNLKRAMKRYAEACKKGSKIACAKAKPGSNKRNK